MRRRLLVVLLTLGGGAVAATPAPAAAQACTQTLSVGADVHTAVATAANGAVICLNSGNYGATNLSNMPSRTGVVTLRSTTGTGATLAAVEVWDSKFITLQNLTLAGATVFGCSTHIQIVNSVFAPETTGLLFNYPDPCPGVTDMALLVDGVTFDRVQQALFEGRLSVRGVNGLTIRNSIFSNVPATNPSDGIQVVGGSSNITIGPGNLFDGITESLCGAVHCDAIQLFGAGSPILITGNQFTTTTSTFIMAPDGSTNVTVENNVFDARSGSHDPRVQMGTAANAIQRHNTVIGTNLGCTSKIENPVASTNCLVENNILVNAVVDFSYGAGCTGCTQRYNLFQVASDASGTNSLIGTPIFTGGTYPATWAGWQLAADSPGKNAASDGLDRGVVFAGGTPPPNTFSLALAASSYGLTGAVATLTQFAGPLKIGFIHTAILTIILVAVLRSKRRIGGPR